MFIAPVRPQRRLVRRAGFTLLEITLAVAILGMMSLAIYRFVATNLIAVRVSSEVNASDTTYAGFEDLLTAQLQDLPTGQGALSGQPFKFSGRSRDEMTWVCPAGPGLFTRYAIGDYEVTMKLRPIPHSDLMELGVSRESADDDTESSKANPGWVPLIEDVRSMEIRYYDPRLNAWVDRWTDSGSLPHLVRVSIMHAGASIPWEAIIPLRRSPL